jgi:hypothetical protein
VAAGLLLVLAAWAVVADAGGRQQASRDTGHPSRREEQGSDGKVGPRATAKTTKPNDASGDSVTLPQREYQELVDAARGARNREKAEQAAKKDQEKTEQESKKEQEKAALDRKRRAIRHLLEEDEKVAGETTRKVGDREPPSKHARAIREYCARCEKIDTTDCPAPVLVAYQRHLAAWQSLERLVTTRWNGPIINETGYRELMAANKEIERTWGDVTDRAAEYDVVLGR